MLSALSVKTTDFISILFGHRAIDRILINLIIIEGRASL